MPTQPGTDSSGGCGAEQACKGYGLSATLLSVRASGRVEGIEPVAGPHGLLESALDPIDCDRDECGVEREADDAVHQDPSPHGAGRDGDVGHGERGSNCRSEIEKFSELRHGAVRVVQATLTGVLSCVDLREGGVKQEPGQQNRCRRQRLHDASAFTSLRFALTMSPPASPIQLISTAKNWVYHRGPTSSGMSSEDSVGSSRRMTTHPAIMYATAAVFQARSGNATCPARRNSTSHVTPRTARTDSSTIGLPHRIPPLVRTRYSREWPSTGYRDSRRDPVATGVSAAASVVRGGAIGLPEEIACQLHCPDAACAGSSGSQDPRVTREIVRQSSNGQQVRHRGPFTSVMCRCTCALLSDQGFALGRDIPICPAFPTPLRHRNAGLT